MTVRMTVRKSRELLECDMVLMLAQMEWWYYYKCTTLTCILE